MIPKRSVIEVEGRDAVKFLQGLITNQMAKIERGGDGIVAAFLSAQGRVLYDAFIYPKNVGPSFPHPSFLVECDAEAKDPLYKHLKKYLLRAKVTITDVSDAYSVYQAWGPKATLHWQSFVQSSVPKAIPPGSLVLKDRFSDIGCGDPRHHELGVRFLLTKDCKLPLPTSYTQVNVETYHARRMLLGIPEGASELFANTALPLESNFDLISGVDFRKGCYLGQELTIRTYHTGVIRKRIVPFFIKPKNSSTEDVGLEVDENAKMDAPLSGSLITGEGAVGKRGEAGKFCGSVFNVGLGLMRLDRISESEGVLVMENGMVVKPYIPNWWPSPIQE
ncbi:Iron-sulfur clusters incorporation protein [Phlyctochytrium planicorne]|nr:Iron-sulfur clusters incorporation protein [Phlyctochytrium planicorne]